MESWIDFYECPPRDFVFVLFGLGAIVVIYLIRQGIKWLQKRLRPPAPKPLEPAPRADIIAIFDALRTNATNHHRTEYHLALGDAQSRVIAYLASRRLVDAGPNVDAVPAAKTQ